MKNKFNVGAVISVLPAFLLIACQDGSSSPPSHSNSTANNLNNLSSPTPSPKQTPPPPSSSNSGSNLIHSPQELFSDQELKGWTIEQISQIPIPQISAITARQIKLLSREQVQAFTPSQISALHPEQIKALASKDSNASLRDLSNEQLRALRSNLSGLKDLYPLEQSLALSPNQFEFIFKKEYDARDVLRSTLLYKIYEHRVVSKLGIRWEPKDIANMKPEELIKLDELEMRELFVSARMLTPDQIRAIKSEFIKFFWSFAMLSDAQIQAFQPEQEVEFSREQLSLLSPSEEKWASINSDIQKVRELSKNFIIALFPNDVPNDVHDGDDQIKSMQPSEIKKLVEQNDYITIKFLLIHQQFLNEGQSQAIPPHCIKLFSKADIEFLEIDQLTSISPAQFKELDACDLSGLRAELIPHLTEAQFKALTPEQLDELKRCPDRKKVLLDLRFSDLSQ